MLEHTRNTHPPVAAVLFDLDGTLLDSAPDLAAAANHLRARRGLEALPPAHYRPWAGAGARGMLAVGFGLGPQDAGFDALRDEFLARYAQCLSERTRPFDGVPELLERLRAANIPWGVVTNKYARFTEPLTCSMALFDAAAAIVSGDSTPHAKPHPAPLFEAARRMRVAPAACIYVGDDARDIAAGKAAGMRTVAACYGYLGHDAHVPDWQADACIATPLALWAWLRGLG